MFRVLLSAALLAALAACVTDGTTRLAATVEAASKLQPVDAGKPIAVRVTNAKGERSLLLDQLAPPIRAELAARGFTVVDDESKARLLALATFAIDGGRRVLSTYDVPQWGITGYTATTTPGYVSPYYTGPGSVMPGTTYLTPQYGVTGSRAEISESTVFARIMTLGISERRDGGLQPVFEGRLRSEGSCGNLTKVAPFLVKSMFDKFPAGGAGEVVTPTPDLDC